MMEKASPHSKSHSQPPPLLSVSDMVHQHNKRKVNTPSPTLNSMNFSMKKLTASTSTCNGSLNLTMNKSSSATKNVGVGANLNPSSRSPSGRHSSPSVALGHGHVGAINCPSSVSISSSTNKSSVTPSSLGLPNPNVNNVPLNLLGNGVPSPIPQVIPELIPQGSSGGGGLMKKVGGGGSISPGAKGKPIVAGGRGAGEVMPVTPTPIPQAQASKIVSQNVNGDLALTGIPRTDSELQLFRVLQRANLLSYFDIMIELGGDDVQQLCEAGEEEFLEIMALIGMASKPLHVRRLQKALQEWMTNQALFQAPVLPPGLPVGGPPAGRGGGSAFPASTSASPSPSSSSSSSSSTPGLPLMTPTPSSNPVHPHHHMQISSARPSPTSPAPPPPSQTGQGQQTLPIRPIPSFHHQHPHMGSSPSAGSAAAVMAAAAQHAAMMFQNGDGGLRQKLHISTGVNNFNGHHSSNSNSPSHSSSSTSPVVRPTSNPSPTNNRSTVITTSATTTLSNGHLKSSNASSHEVRIPVDQLIPAHFLEQRIRTGSEPSSPAASESNSESGSSHSPVPFLQDGELAKIAEAAAQTVKTLPPYVFEPQVPSKRKFSGGDFEMVMRMPLNDPRRMEEIRKMSTIFGRPDPNCSTYPNKRKFPKPLSMYEVCVNDAASQLCKHVPALLTYRDELSALAKQVVRDSSLPYSSSHNSQAFSSSIALNNNNNVNYSNQNNKKSMGMMLDVSNFSAMNGSAGNSGSTSPFLSDHSSGGAIKRLRMDASNGLEIQEYSQPPSNCSDSSSLHDQDSGTQQMQITPIRNVLRRSPTSELSPLPLELVTVTTSPRSKSSSLPPDASGSSPRRRSGGERSPSTTTEDLSYLGKFHKAINHSSSNSSSNSNDGVTNNGMPNSSIKIITSIPVNGGCINISHDASSSSSPSSSAMKLLPIKTEPTN